MRPKSIGVNVEDFKITFNEYFSDLLYSLCLTLRQADTNNDEFDTYQNQAKVHVRKIGLDRIRSMELLKHIFDCMNKHFAAPSAAQANA